MLFYRQYESALFNILHVIETKFVVTNISLKYAQKHNSHRLEKRLFFEVRSGVKKLLIIVQPLGSTPIMKIDAWYALRMKKRPMKRTMD